MYMYMYMYMCMHQVPLRRALLPGAPAPGP